MDPQTCADGIVSYVALKDWDEAFNSIRDLDAWLRRGGFKPKFPPTFNCSISLGGPYCYSVLPHVNGTHSFTVWEFMAGAGQYIEARTYLL